LCDREPTALRSTDLTTPVEGGRKQRSAGWAQGSSVAKQSTLTRSERESATTFTVHPAEFRVGHGLTFAG
jgi:hypothetical protein